eukprot:gnl/MRDRNA2_/MRDRNA2_80987_c0_seq2.p1 gnl/MRDRNA2_/MRDRNA2_80987_c0~~gnl/MRDRNA2_/MRDRNA2_80987_c0_seq2.p1  ORF type:complete len:1176 (-),score=169.67 gnl/MRDRNA2_/MRDRNA2_80987_c0_seq2:21-3173(-)
MAAPPVFSEQDRLANDYRAQEAVHLILGETERMCAAQQRDLDVANRRMNQSIMAIERGVDMRMKAMVDTMLRETENSWRQQADYKRICEKRVANVIIWLRIEVHLRQTLHAWAAQVRRLRCGTLLLMTSMERRRACIGRSLLCRRVWEADAMPCLRETLLAWCQITTSELLCKERVRQDALHLNARRVSVQSDLHNSHLWEAMFRSREYFLVVEVFMLWASGCMQRSTEKAARQQVLRIRQKRDAQLHRLACVAHTTAERARLHVVWHDWAHKASLNQAVNKAEKIVANGKNAEAISAQARNARAQQVRLRLVATIAKRDRFATLLRILTAWRSFQKAWERIAKASSSSTLKALTFACWLLAIKERREAEAAASRSDEIARRGQRMLAGMLQSQSAAFLRASLSMWRHESARIQLEKGNCRDDARRMQLVQMLCSSKSSTFSSMLVTAWARVVQCQTKQSAEEQYMDHVEQLKAGLASAQATTEQYKAAQVKTLSFLFFFQEGRHLLPKWLHAWRMVAARTQWSLESESHRQQHQEDAYAAIQAASERCRRVMCRALEATNSNQLIWSKCWEAWRRETCESRQITAAKLSNREALAKASIMALAEQSESTLKLIMVAWRQMTIVSLGLQDLQRQAQDNQDSAERRLHERGLKFTYAMLTQQDSSSVWGALRLWRDVVREVVRSRNEELRHIRSCRLSTTVCCERLLCTVDGQRAELVMHAVFLSWACGWLTVRGAIVARQRKESAEKIVQKTSGVLDEAILDQLQLSETPEVVNHRVSRRLLLTGYEKWRELVMLMKGKIRTVAQLEQYRLQSLLQQTMVFFKHAIHKIKFEQEAQRRRSTVTVPLMGQSPLPHAATRERSASGSASLMINPSPMMPSPRTSQSFSPGRTPLLSPAGSASLAASAGRASILSPRHSQIQNLEVMRSPMTPRSISFDVAESPAPSMRSALSAAPRFSAEGDVPREQHPANPPRANSPSRQRVTIAVPPSVPLSSSQNPRSFPSRQRLTIGAPQHVPSGSSSDPPSSPSKIESRLSAAFPSAGVHSPARSSI